MANFKFKYLTPLRTFEGDVLFEGFYAYDVNYRAVLTVPLLNRSYIKELCVCVCVYVCVFVCNECVNVRSNVWYCKF